MDCSAVSMLLSADLDGELATPEMAIVKEHLASCSRCTEKRRLLENTRRAFQLVGPSAVPADFDDGVRLRLRRPRLRARLWLPATAALVAALGFLLVRPVPPDSGAVTTPGTIEPILAASEIDCGVAGPVLCRPTVPCGEGQCLPSSTATQLVLAGSRLVAASH
jgi:predicted anti-sigma-YlaC factor YlaD